MDIGNNPMPAAFQDRFVVDLWLSPVCEKDFLKIVLASHQPSSPPTRVLLSEVVALQKMFRARALRDEEATALGAFLLSLRRLIAEQSVGNQGGSDAWLQPGTHVGERAFKMLVQFLKALAAICSQGEPERMIVSPDLALKVIVPFLRHRVTPAHEISPDEFENRLFQMAFEAYQRARVGMHA
jgi:MoxR-like ATPase